MNRFQTIVATALLLAAIRPAAAAEDLKHGEALLARDCGHCHAVGRTGNSLDKEAPPFRSLGTRYPIESLEEALARASCPATLTCRNSSMTPTTSVASLPI